MNFEKYLNLAFEPTEKILEVQELLLRKHIKYAYKNSPYYRKTLKLEKSDIDNFSLKELKFLPFTDKNNFTENNRKFLASANDNIIDISLTSGTTGEFAEIMYTENDIIRLAYNEKKALSG